MGTALGRRQRQGFPQRWQGSLAGTVELRSEDRLFPLQKLEGEFGIGLRHWDIVCTMNLTPTILAAARAGDQTLLSQAVLSHTQKSVRSQLQPIEKEPKACELFRLEAKGDRVKVVNCYRFTTTHVGLVKGNRKIQVWEGYVDEEGMEISRPEGAEDYLVLKNGNVEVSNRLRLG